MKTRNSKEIAYIFLLMLSSDNVKKAFETLVSPNFIYHYSGISADKNFLQNQVQTLANDYPNRKIVINHIIEEGCLVAVHFIDQKNSSDEGSEIVQFFKIENGKIIELREIVQPLL